MKVGRREFFIVAGSGFWVSLGRRARTQSRAAVISSQVTVSRAAALQLLEQVQAVGIKATPDTTGRFVQQELNLRRQLLGTLAMVPTESRDEYVLAEERDLARILREEDVPLVPSAGDMVPIAIQAQQPVPGCDESVISVCADVLLATLGLDEEFRAVLARGLQEDVELRDLLDDLVRAIANGRDRDAIDVIRAMLRVLATERFRRAVVLLLGAEMWDRMKRRLYVRIGLALVPFAGWIFAGIGAAIAVYQRWDRLVIAVKCSQRVAYLER